MAGGGGLARSPFGRADDLGQKVRPVDGRRAVNHLDLAHSLQLAHFEVAPHHVARAVAALLVLGELDGTLVVDVDLGRLGLRQLHLVEEAAKVNGLKSAR